MLLTQNTYGMSLLDNLFRFHGKSAVETADNLYLLYKQKLRFRYLASMNDGLAAIPEKDIQPLITTSLNKFN